MNPEGLFLQEIKGSISLRKRIHHFARSRLRSLSAKNMGIEPVESVKWVEHWLNVAARVRNFVWEYLNIAMGKNQEMILNGRIGFVVLFARWHPNDPCLQGSKRTPRTIGGGDDAFNTFLSFWSKLQGSDCLDTSKEFVLIWVFPKIGVLPIHPF